MPTLTHAPPLTRRTLETLNLVALHRARNWSKADVSLLEWPVGSGQQLVIKDFARRPLWFRVIMGRALLRREWRTLRALRDVDGVPAAHQRIDADAFLMDYCEGQKVSDVSEASMPPGLVDSIEALVKVIHSRGVTHGDLHTDNILITEKGCGFALIDWATAYYFGTHPRGWRQVIFHELSALDDRAMAKLKVMYQPASVTERQRDLLLNGGSSVYRGFKSLRHFLEKLRGRDKTAYRAQKVKNYQERLERHQDKQPPQSNN